MNTFLIEYVPFIAGCYLILMGTVVTTHTLTAKVLWQGGPILFGIALLLPTFAKYAL